MLSLVCDSELQYVKYKLLGYHVLVSSMSYMFILRRFVALEMYSSIYSKLRVLACMLFSPQENFLVLADDYCHLAHL